MSLPWVKLHVNLMNNADFQRFSPGAKLTFVTCLMLAGDLDKGDYSGRLMAATGPLTVEEIAKKTGMGAKRQEEALRELLGPAEFLSIDLSGCYIVERFEEKAAPLSAISTARVKRARERKRNAPETLLKRFRNGAEAEVEAESNYASLRSAALDFKTWPTQPAEIKALALVFIQRFANCSPEKASRRDLRQYTSALVEWRQRYTIEQVWAACEECWLVGDRVPLFGGEIWHAKSYFKASDANGRHRPVPQYRELVEDDAR